MNRTVRLRRWSLVILVIALTSAAVLASRPAGHAQQRAQIDGTRLLAEPTLVADLIEARVEQVVAECMVARGFEYEPLPPPTPPEEPERGYGIATADNGDVSIVDDNVRRLTDLSEEDRVEYEIALYGAPLDELDGERPGGCAAEAQPVLDEITEALRAVDDILAGAAAAIESDDRLARAEREWAACMDENGLEYDTLVGPPADFAARLEAAGAAEEQLAELAAEEERVARIDAACREESVDGVIADVVAEQLPELDAAAAILAEAVSR